MSLQGFEIDGLFIPVPIVQGGMGVGISLSGLASAVANEGGVGVISAAMIGFREPDVSSNYREANIRALRKEIRLAREKTKGVLGVNIMASMTNFDDMVVCSLEEGVDIIISGGGMPRNLPAFVSPEHKTKLVPVVSSGRAAELLARIWKTRYDRLPDAFVVEGPLAGGHLGFSMEALDDESVTLENLVDDVLAVAEKLRETHGKKIPVIAAGGIHSHEDIKRMLARGASAVQMGTRFVATHECDADIRFKEAYVAAEKEDITIIKSPLGLPGRALRGSFLEDVAQGKRKPHSCYCHCLASCTVDKAPYCIGLALANAQRGRLKAGFAFCGANAWRIDKIVSVHELMRELTTGE